MEGRGVERNAWQAMRYLEPAAKAGEWGALVRAGFDRCLDRRCSDFVMNLSSLFMLCIGV
jgi:hypothetical protein